MITILQLIKLFGWNDPYYVKGQNATFDGETGHMEKGMVTTKHAMAFKHTPDYRVEGQDIKVYPGDKVVIKKPSFYIKNFKVLSLPSYTASLRHDKEGKFSIFSLVPNLHIVVMMALVCMVVQSIQSVSMVKPILITVCIQSLDLNQK